MSQNSDPQSAAPFPGTRVDAWKIFSRLASLCCIATLLGFLGGLWWSLDNIACFRAQLCFALLCAALAFKRGKRPNAALVTLAFALVNAVGYVPLYFGRDAVQGPAQFRVMESNVNSSNRDFQRVIDFVRANKPDAVIFLEVDSAWAGQLRQLRDDYPYSRHLARPDNFGIAFYSRTEPEELSLRYFGAAEVPTIVARYTLNGKALTLIGTHPVPPISAEYVSYRNDQLATLAAFIAASPNAVALVGDLNMTSDSPVFTEFLSRSGLRDSRAGFGIQPTWPAQFPPLFIAIDHALVSRQIKVHDRFAGPHVGSDHHPIVVDISLK